MQYPDKCVFPAIFDYGNESIKISFPDLPGALSCGEGQDEAIKNANEILKECLLKLEAAEVQIPEPSKIENIKLGKKQAIVLIEINMDIAREKERNTLVKKTLKIPTYVNKAGVEAGVNFSNELTEALKKKLDLD